MFEDSIAMLKYMRVHFLTIIMAHNRGGVMNLGGVILIIDMDTVIANNTADSSGNVISACVSQITAYGLEAQLDPVYPLYCSIYDEGNTSHMYPTTQSITTIPMPGPTTEHEVTTSPEHTYETRSLVTTIAPEKSTTKIATNIPSTTSSLSITTPQPTSSNEVTTTYPITKAESNPQFTDSPTVKVHTGTQSNMDKMTTISEEATTAATIAQTSIRSPVIASDSGHKGSTKITTKHSEMPTATDKITSQTKDEGYSSNPTDTITETVFSLSKDSNVTLTLSEHAELQDEQDRTIQIASQHDLLQVAIISLVVLAIVCIAVCAIMVTLFVMACMRKSTQITRQGQYKRLSQVEKVHKEAQETQEYPFTEI